MQLIHKKLAFRALFVSLTVTVFNNKPVEIIVEQPTSPQEYSFNNGNRKQAEKIKKIILSQPYTINHNNFNNYLKLLITRSKEVEHLINTSAENKKAAEKQIKQINKKCKIAEYALVYSGLYSVDLTIPHIPVYTDIIRYSSALITASASSIMLIYYNQQKKELRNARTNALNYIQEYGEYKKILDDLIRFLKDYQQKQQ